MFIFDLNPSQIQKDDHSYSTVVKRSFSVFFRSLSSLYEAENHGFYNGVFDLIFVVDFTDYLKLFCSSSMCRIL